MLYFGCIGMFGIGVGMLYTPILVDRLQLDIRRDRGREHSARADRSELLRRSISRLGGGAAGGHRRGARGQIASLVVVHARPVRVSTIGAGLIVGSRIGVPAVVMAGIGGF